MKMLKEQKILITGVTGFLGKKLMKLLPELGFEVIGTASEATGKIIKMDVTDAKEVIEVISREKPSAVIHAAAITKVDWCEDHKEETFRVNVDGTRNVSEACKDVGAKMVFVSTDYVFDGTKKGKYVETDARNPIGVYAQSKYEGEKAVEQAIENHIIARVSVIYGYNDSKDKETFVTYVKRILESKKELYGFRTHC